MVRLMKVSTKKVSEAYMRRYIVVVIQAMLSAYPPTAMSA